MRHGVIFPRSDIYINILHEPGIAPQPRIRHTLNTETISMPAPTSSVNHSKPSTPKSMADKPASMSQIRECLTKLSHLRNRIFEHIITEKPSRLPTTLPPLLKSSVAQFSEMSGVLSTLDTPSTGFRGMVQELEKERNWNMQLMTLWASVGEEDNPDAGATEFVEDIARLWDDMGFDNLMRIGEENDAEAIESGAEELKNKAANEIKSSSKQASKSQEDIDSNFKVIKQEKNRQNPEIKQPESSQNKNHIDYFGNPDKNDNDNISALENSRENNEIFNFGDTVQIKPQTTPLEPNNIRKKPIIETTKQAKPELNFWKEGSQPDKNENKTKSRRSVAVDKGDPFFDDHNLQVEVKDEPPAFQTGFNFDDFGEASQSVNNMSREEKNVSNNHNAPSMSHHSRRSNHTENARGKAPSIKIRGPNSPDVLANPPAELKEGIKMKSITDFFKNDNQENLDIPPNLFEKSHHLSDLSKQQRTKNKPTPLAKAEQVQLVNAQAHMEPTPLKEGPKLEMPISKIDEPHSKPFAALFAEDSLDRPSSAMASKKDIRRIARSRSRIADKSESREDRMAMSVPGIHTHFHKLNTVRLKIPGRQDYSEIVGQNKGDRFPVTTAMISEKAEVPPLRISKLEETQPSKPNLYKDEPDQNQEAISSNRKQSIEIQKAIFEVNPTIENTTVAHADPQIFFDAFDPVHVPVTEFSRPTQEPINFWQDPEENDNNKIVEDLSDFQPQLRVSNHADLPISISAPTGPLPLPLASSNKSRGENPPQAVFDFDDFDEASGDELGDQVDLPGDFGDESVGDRIIRGSDLKPNHAAHGSDMLEQIGRSDLFGKQLEVLDNKFIQPEEKDIGSPQQFNPNELEHIGGFFSQAQRPAKGSYQLDDSIPDFPAAQQIIQNNSKAQSEVEDYFAKNDGPSPVHSKDKYDLSPINPFQVRLNEPLQQLARETVNGGKTPTFHQVQQLQGSSEKHIPPAPVVLPNSIRPGQARTVYVGSHQHNPSDNQLINSITNDRPIAHLLHETNTQFPLEAPTLVDLPLQDPITPVFHTSIIPSKIYTPTLQKAQLAIQSIQTPPIPSALRPEPPVLQPILLNTFTVPSQTNSLSNQLKHERSLRQQLETKIHFIETANKETTASRILVLEADNNMIRRDLESSKREVVEAEERENRTAKEVHEIQKQNMVMMKDCYEKEKEVEEAKHKFTDLIKKHTSLLRNVEDHEKREAELRRELNENHSRLMSMAERNEAAILASQVQDESIHQQSQKALITSLETRVSLLLTSNVDLKTMLLESQVSMSLLQSSQSLDNSTLSSLLNRDTEYSDRNQKLEAENKSLQHRIEEFEEEIHRLQKWEREGRLVKDILLTPGEAGEDAINILRNLITQTSKIEYVNSNGKEGMGLEYMWEAKRQDHVGSLLKQSSLKAVVIEPGSGNRLVQNIHLNIENKQMLANQSPEKDQHALLISFGGSPRTSSARSEKELLAKDSGEFTQAKPSENATVRHDTQQELKFNDKSRSLVPQLVQSSISQPWTSVDNQHTFDKTQKHSIELIQQVDSNKTNKVPFLSLLQPVTDPIIDNTTTKTPTAIATSPDAKPSGEILMGSQSPLQTQQSIYSTNITSNVPTSPHIAPALLLPSFSKTVPSSNLSAQPITSSISPNSLSYIKRVDPLQDYYSALHRLIPNEMASEFKQAAIQRRSKIGKIEFHSELKEQGNVVVKLSVSSGRVFKIGDSFSDVLDIPESEARFCLPRVIDLEIVDDATESKRVETIIVPITSFSFLTPLQTSAAQARQLYEHPELKDLSMTVYNYNPKATVGRIISYQNCSRNAYHCS